MGAAVRLFALGLLGVVVVSVLVCRSADSSVSAAEHAPVPPLVQERTTPMNETLGHRSVTEALCRIEIEWTSATLRLPSTPCIGLHHVEDGQGGEVSLRVVLTRSTTRYRFLQHYQRSVCNVAAYARWKGLTQIVGVWKSPSYPRSAHYSRILTIEKVLQLSADVGVVVHVDLDMWFTVRAFSLPVVSMLDWLPPDANWSVAVQDDYPLMNQNSGFFAVRRTPQADLFLKTWWESAEGGCCLHPNTMDQECMHVALLRLVEGEWGVRETVECKDAVLRFPGRAPQQARVHHMNGNATLAATVYAAFTRALTGNFPADVTSRPDSVGVPRLSDRRWQSVLFISSNGTTLVSGLAHDTSNLDVWRLRRRSLLFHSGGAIMQRALFPGLVFVPRPSTPLPVPSEWAELEFSIYRTATYRHKICILPDTRDVHAYVQKGKYPYPEPELNLPGGRHLLRAVKMKKGAMNEIRVALREKKCRPMQRLVDALIESRPYPHAFESGPLVMPPLPPKGSKGSERWTSKAEG
eukprot:Hpha_TRINITY_DN33911_c0_g1::TRINITY_DN33911_c0_g1_i1::g.69364::m.69364